MRSVALTLALAGALAGCTQPRTISAAQAADICEERANEVVGISGTAGVGVNSSTGLVGDVAIQLSLTSDSFSPSSRLSVYQGCVFDLTGQPPIRPLRQQ